MKLSIFTFFTLAIALSSCNNDVIRDQPRPLVQIAFSTSPIDLQGVDAQYAADVPYDDYEKTTFDIFIPNSLGYSPLVVFIHGGGFTGGDKDFLYSATFAEDVVELLSNNIAVATINYRLIQENDSEGVLKSLNDSKRAIQYIRYIYQELNIDKDKIALFGSSAGGSTSLWLATNDDLKDGNNIDPVLRQSSRVSGIALNATQSSLDIEGRWINDVFGDFNPVWEDVVAQFGTETLFSFYGVDSWEQYESPETDAYRESVDMLSFLSADDPEIWVKNTGTINDAPQSIGQWYHHPFHAREIKAFADAAGVPIVSQYGKPLLVNDSNDEEYVDFLIRKLSE